MVPDRALFRAGRPEQPIEIILPSAPLKIDQLRNAEAAQALAEIGYDRLQQRE